MSTETSDSAPGGTLDQRMRALRHANEVRIGRARLKREVASGSVRIDQIIDQPPEFAKAAKGLPAARAAVDRSCQGDALDVIHASDGNIPADMALTMKEGLGEEQATVLRRADAATAHAHHLRPTALLPPSARPRRHAHGYGKSSRHS